jgi:hypothetical protein
MKGGVEDCRKLTPVLSQMNPTQDPLHVCACLLTLATVADGLEAMAVAQWPT